MWSTCFKRVYMCFNRPGSPMVYPPGFNVPDPRLIKQEPVERLGFPIYDCDNYTKNNFCLPGKVKIMNSKH